MRRHGIALALLAACGPPNIGARFASAVPSSGPACVPELAGNAWFANGVDLDVELLIMNPDTDRPRPGLNGKTVSVYASEAAPGPIVETWLADLEVSDSRVRFQHPLDLDLEPGGESSVTFRAYHEGDAGAVEAHVVEPPAEGAAVLCALWTHPDGGRIVYGDRPTEVAAHVQLVGDADDVDVRLVVESAPDSGDIDAGEPDVYDLVEERLVPGTDAPIVERFPRDPDHWVRLRVETLRAGEVEDADLVTLIAGW